MLPNLGKIGHWVSIFQIKHTFLEFFLKRIILVLVCHCSWIISQFNPGTHNSAQARFSWQVLFARVIVCTAKNRQFLLAKGQGALLQSQLCTRKICSCVWSRKTSQVYKWRNTVPFYGFGKQRRPAWTWDKCLTTRKTCQGKRARSSLLSTGLLINTVTFSIILRKIWEKQIKNSRSYRSVRKLIHTPIYIWHSGLFLSFRTY